jgi:hypothetical protein
VFIGASKGSIVWFSGRGKPHRLQANSTPAANFAIVIEALLLRK